MKHTFSAAALALTFVGALAAPSAAADKETRQLMADVRMLQEQSQELQNQLQGLLSSLGEALKAVNTRLDQQAETTRKAFADQKVGLDAASGDLRVIRERMDDNNVRVGSLTQEVDALRQTVLQLRVPQSAPPEAQDALGGSAVSGAGAAVPPAPALAGGLSPQKSFDQAMADYYSGQYDMAVIGLAAFIKDFPRSEQAADAQVGIGNSYLLAGRNDKAIEAYDLAIRNYPKGNAIPEAYYKKGLALRDLKQIDAARTAFEYVTTTYPNRNEAVLASQMLQELNRQPPPQLKRP
jgi:tol-pal system protein YbgF